MKTLNTETGLRQNDFVWNDAQTAFEIAIEAGRLSASARDWNYAGRFMYMGTQAGRDLFKNSVTREYLK